MEKFVADMRGLFEEPLTDRERWQQAAGLLKPVLLDPALKEHSKTWPDSPALLGLEGKHGNLIFYEDPDYKFVVNGLIKKPGAKTTIHDHGISWTLYGVVEGQENVLRYERADGGQPGDLPKQAEVMATDRSAVIPGHVDLIEPWEIHAEHNDDRRTVALIVRSQRSGTYIQNIFYAHDNSVEQYWGPKQIPFDLA
jgi:predicted metal-dependent enzyme (double-stranded beta helix superfamily)